MSEGIEKKCINIEKKPINITHSYSISIYRWYGALAPPLIFIYSYYSPPSISQPVVAAPPHQSVICSRSCLINHDTPPALLQSTTVVYHTSS